MNGIQSVYYLTELARPLQTWAGLIGAEAQALIGSLAVGPPMHTNHDLDVWEHRIEDQIESSPDSAPTEREAIIRARRGQGLFNQHVMEMEKR